jgi:hypothetical protein
MCYAELARHSGRLPCMIGGGAWRPARLALLRSLRVVTWPFWRLGVAWERRDPQIAEYVQDRVAARYSRDLGPYHLATLRAQVDHAVAVSKLGELQQAEAELTEVIIRLNPLVDGDARLLLDVRRWHHRVLVELGWVAETEADARFVAESYARQLGSGHPDTLHWRRMMAVALWEAGRRDEATAEMADAAARLAATQGANHPDTLQAERVLSSMTSNENATFRIRPPAE